MIIKNSIKEVFRSWSFSALFVLSLSLGLSAFLILNSFQEALQKEASLNSKNILSADISISARRKLLESELQTAINSLPQGAQVSEVYEFFAMLRTKNGSRLVMVKAIDESYPFYGSLNLKKLNDLDSKNKSSLKSKILISQELQDHLGLQVGEQTDLGNAQFVVEDIIIKDSTQTFRAATLAPRVFISLQDLGKTGLIQFGSTFSHAYLFKLPEGYKTDSFQKTISQKIPDPSVTIETAQTAAQNSSRQLQYLFDYLGLAAIVSLFLSSLGGVYLFRLYLNSKNKHIAVYRAIGFMPVHVFYMYLTQIVFLSLASMIPAIGIALLFNPLFSKFISQVSSFELNAYISAHSIGITAAIAVIGSVLTSLPQLLEVKSLSPVQLFQEDLRPKKNKYLSVYIFSFLFFTALSVYQSNSWKVGLSFVGGLVLIVITLTLVGSLLFEGLLIFKKIKFWFVKYGFFAVARNKRAALSVFVSLGIGTLLINLLPQLKASLQNEFRPQSNLQIPSLFLFDIQDDQIKEFQEFLKFKKITPMSISPLVKSRIIFVNNKPFERKKEESVFVTREEEQDSRFRNRGVNLSYRGALSNTEEIVDGEWNGEVYDFSSEKPFQISVEKQYANRMGFKLGDLVSFDIQGLELTGKITSFRKVRWTSFQPNFFMLLQPGVIEDAPKTYIVSLPQISLSQEKEIQNEIFKNFSNVSALNVKSVVDDVLKIADQMSWSLELMSLLAILAGYMILYSVVRTHLYAQRYEFSMMKVLGANSLGVLFYVWSQYITQTVLAAALGSFLSIGVSYGISYFIFEGSFAVNLTTLVGVFCGVVLLTLIVSSLAAIRILKIKPASILKDEL